ncbi:collagen alpha-1(III) chain-like [Hirundo rustica]|uniref:collagen alpha-1(III) chain-like n=1 Tax=Hirundo rustica TaxID=43150 RepID=UPI001A94EBC6|nr:collagen alpha-1(III) chain-like [Hirundo rustica]
MTRIPPGSVAARRRRDASGGWVLGRRAGGMRDRVPARGHVLAATCRGHAPSPAPRAHVRGPPPDSAGHAGAASTRDRAERPGRARAEAGGGGGGSAFPTRRWPPAARSAPSPPVPGPVTRGRVPERRRTRVRARGPGEGVSRGGRVPPPPPGSGASARAAPSERRGARGAGARGVSSGNRARSQWQRRGGRGVGSQGTGEERAALPPHPRSLPPLPLPRGGGWRWPRRVGARCPCAEMTHGPVTSRESAARGPSHTKSGGGSAGSSGGRCSRPRRPGAPVAPRGAEVSLAAAAGGDGRRSTHPTASGERRPGGWGRNGAGGGGASGGGAGPAPPPAARGPGPRGRGALCSPLRTVLRRRGSRAPDPGASIRGAGGGGQRGAGEGGGGAAERSRRRHLQPHLNPFPPPPPPRAGHIDPPGQRSDRKHQPPPPPRARGSDRGSGRGRAACGARGASLAAAPAPGRGLAPPPPRAPLPRGGRSAAPRWARGGSSGRERAARHRYRHRPAASRGHAFPGSQGPARPIVRGGRSCGRPVGRLRWNSWRSLPGRALRGPVKGTAGERAAPGPIISPQVTRGFPALPPPRSPPAAPAPITARFPCPGRPLPLPYFSLRCVHTALCK